MNGKLTLEMNDQAANAFRDGIRDVQTLFSYGIRVTLCDVTGDVVDTVEVYDPSNTQDAVNSINGMLGDAGVKWKCTRDTVEKMLSEWSYVSHVDDCQYSVDL